MSSNTEFIDLLRNLCEMHSMHLQDVGDHSFKIFTDEASGITLLLTVKEPTDFSFYYLVRTHDVVYHGDRSDAHVIVSLMFASFLRSLDSGVSCSLFDIPHPVVDGEIWGRYIMPEQMPSFLGISSWDKLKNCVAELFSILNSWRYIFWNFAGCPCEKCLKENNIDTTREYELPPELLKLRDRLSKSSFNVNYGNRLRPNWSYFYDTKHEVTIIKSEGLSKYLASVQKLREKKIEKLDGIHGTFILEGEIKNFLNHKHIKELNKLMKDLFQSSKQVNFNIFPLENMIVAVADPYIIGLGRLCGFNEFRLERERLRERHNREAEFLFPIALYEWQEDICPEQFEGLIKALLERESNVKTVRKPAPTNQGDKGRDLLIEWYIRDSAVVSNTSPPTSLIKVVGQCKASNNTVGKNKVIDIRDTVESHSANGYFLAVSTQISAPLTEKLEELQAKGIWTEWWNREDIEIRLSRNPDLLPLFPKVVKAKHQIKFVEKE